MLKEKVNSIKDYILSNNTYFKQGFADVYLDEKTGMIHNKKPVFPADNLGNYFYLRLPNNVTFTYNRDFNVSECITGTGLTANIILVAYVKDADADLLIQNIINTLQTIEDVKVTSAIYKSEVVVLQELAKMKEENMMNALSKIKETIVSVSFTLTSLYTFQKLSCIVNPCKTCS